MSDEITNKITNGLSSHDMILQMYEILVTGKGENPPLPEQVRTNATNIKYLKSSRIFKVILSIIAIGQGFLAWKIIFK